MLYFCNVLTLMLRYFVYLCVYVYFFAPKILILFLFLFLLTVLAYVCAVCFRKFFLHIFVLVKAGTKNFQCVFMCYSRDKVFEKSNLFFVCFFFCFTSSLYATFLLCLLFFYFSLPTLAFSYFQTFHFRIIFPRTLMSSSQAGFSQDLNFLQQMVVSASKSSFGAASFVFKVFIKFLSLIFCFVLFKNLALQYNFTKLLCYVRLYVYHKWFWFLFFFFVFYALVSTFCLLFK